jgi:hypothetical protein
VRVGRYGDATTHANSYFHDQRSDHVAAATLTRIQDSLRRDTELFRHLMNLFGGGVWWRGVLPKPATVSHQATSMNEGQSCSNDSSSVTVTTGVRLNGSATNTRILPSSFSSIHTLTIDGL